MGVDSVVAKALSYLEEKSEDGFYPCYLSDSRDGVGAVPSPREIASAALILRTVFLHRSDSSTKDNITSYLLNALESDNAIYFFEDKSILPLDADTSSYVLSTLIKSESIPLDQTLSFASKIVSNTIGGKIQVYFNPETHGRVNRFDEVALCNMCYFLSQNNFKSEVDEQLPLIVDFFESGKFLNGSRYYFSPDMAIYFASSLLEFPRLKRELSLPLENALLERAGKSNNPIDLAMRVSSARNVGMYAVSDFRSLISLQNDDGSFPIDSIYKYGSKDSYFGSKELSTAFAIEALEKSK